MPVHDNLPVGIRKSVDHHIRQLERFAEPVYDELATLGHLARPLVIGMEDELNALRECIDNLKRRWAYYEAHDAWAGTEEVNGEFEEMNKLPRATGTALKAVKPGDTDKES